MAQLLELLGFREQRWLGNRPLVGGKQQDIRAAGVHLVGLARVNRFLVPDRGVPRGVPRGVRMCWKVAVARLQVPRDESNGTAGLNCGPGISWRNVWPLGPVPNHLKVYSCVFLCRKSYHSCYHNTDGQPTNTVYIK